MKLHHVQLAIPPGAEDKARDFYTEVIGLTEREKPSSLSQDGVWTGDSTSELHLGVDHDFRPARKAHPAILVDNLAQVAYRLKSVGADVRYDDNFPGYRRLYTYDPFGNRLEFIQLLEGDGQDADRSTG